MSHKEGFVYDFFLFIFIKVPCYSYNQSETKFFLLLLFYDKYLITTIEIFDVVTMVEMALLYAGSVGGIGVLLPAPQFHGASPPPRLYHPLPAGNVGEKKKNFGILRKRIISLWLWYQSSYFHRY